MVIICNHLVFSGARLFGIFLGVAIPRPSSLVWQVLRHGYVRGACLWCPCQRLRKLALGFGTIN